MIEWRPVVGYEGLYEVSSTGCVRSIERVVVYTDPRSAAPIRRRRRPNALAQFPHPKTGHMRVNLHRGGAQRSMQVHRLVLFAFAGPCPAGLEALHDDGNPTNNRIENLSWGTKSANMYDKVRHGRNMFALRAACPRGHRLDAPNLRARKQGRECLACSRAGAARRRHGWSHERFVADADARYRAIMGAAA